MFQLYVGNDVKLTFDADDLRSVGPGCGWLCGVVGAVRDGVAGLVEVAGGGGEGVVGGCDKSAAGVAFGSRLDVVSGGEVRCLREQERRVTWDKGVDVPESRLGGRGSVECGAGHFGGGVVREGASAGVAGPATSRLQGAVAADESAVEVGEPRGDQAVVHGPNWERNKLWREKKKKNKNRRRFGSVSVSRPSSWVLACDEVTQRDLRESRAAMLVSRNRADREKADALVKKLRLAREAMVDEREFELRRQRLERDVAKAVTDRFGDVTTGYARTLVDELSEVSGVPTLSAGSVSPSSSASVEMVVRMEKKLSELCQKVSELGVENGVLKERLGRALLREEGGTGGPTLQDFNDVMRAYPEPSEVGDFVPPSDACTEDVRAFYDAYP